MMSDNMALSAKPIIPQLELTVLTATLMSMVAISIDALLPALGFIAKGFALVDGNETQLVISALFLGLALGELISGPFSDSLGRKPVLFTGLAVYFLGTLISYFSSDLNQLLMGRFIQGLGVAGPYISAVSLVRDQYKGRDMAKIMSLVMMIFVLVPAIAPAIGQAVLFVSDWRGIFVLYAAYGAMVLLWIVLRLPETLPKDHRIPFSVNGFLIGFKVVVTHKVTMTLTVSMGCLFGCLVGYLNSSQQIFQERFLVGNMFSVYFGGLALLLGAASLVNSKIVQRLGMYMLSVRALGTIVLSSFVFVLVQMFMTPNLWMFFIYMSIIFFCFGLIFGNVNAMSMEPMGDNAGIASAVIGSMSSIMSLIIGTTIGQFYDGTVLPIAVGFSIAGTVSFSLLILAGRLNSELRQNDESGAEAV